jgi:hypothetical protein
MICLEKTIPKQNSQLSVIRVQKCDSKQIFGTSVLYTYRNWTHMIVLEFCPHSPDMYCMVLANGQWRLEYLKKVIILTKFINFHKIWVLTKYENGDKWL